jgi:type VI secretion system protein ImpF
MPLLDRLIDEAPERAQDVPAAPAEAQSLLRRSVQRDLEALLNARRRWRSWSPSLTQLAVSPLSFGIPDCTGGNFHDPAAGETLRRDIEDTIRRFEPRFRSVHVSIVHSDNSLETTLRLRIEALLQAEPAPEPVAFDTLVDAVTASVLVRASGYE